MAHLELADVQQLPLVQAVVLRHDGRVAPPQLVQPQPEDLLLLDQVLHPEITYYVSLQLQSRRLLQFGRLMPCLWCSSCSPSELRVLCVCSACALRYALRVLCACCLHVCVVAVVCLFVYARVCV